MRTLLTTSLAALLLLGCAGAQAPGASQADTSAPPTVAWSQPVYTLTVEADSSGPRQLDAEVKLEAPYTLPPIIGISIGPTGASENPTCGNGPWIVASQAMKATVPVRVWVSPNAGPGSYPMGQHTLTAYYLHHDGTQVKATATLMVRYK